MAIEPKSIAMLSNRPYLARAFYQWIVDCGLTPILLLDAHHPKCQIPDGYSENGEIAFNISPNAVRDLSISNKMIEFKASFSGAVNIIAAHMQAVIAIYAEENGEGIFFDKDDDIVEDNEFPVIDSVNNKQTSAAKTTQSQVSSAKSFLRLVD